MGAMTEDQEPTAEEVALVRRYWPDIPIEMIDAEAVGRARRLRAANHVSTTRGGGPIPAGDWRTGPWSPPPDDAPRTATEEEPLQTPANQRRQYAKTEQRAAVAILAGLLLLACCVGASAVAAFTVFIQAVG